MNAYYNEHDAFAAQWLRNLIAGGHIAPGDVDERDIRDVRASDLAGYAQCHFFAGIGGWSLALRLAGVPDNRPVWTGSCPCQPFSAAGKGKAADDERHLWPAWLPLIRERRPGTVFGEQVEAAVGWGWLDAVFNDLEAEGYACGAAVLPACSVGAPHIRQRLFFVADAEGEQLHRSRDTRRGRREPANAGIVGDAERDGLRVGGWAAANVSHQSGHWSLCDWIACRDGKARPVEPGIQPLAHGVPARVGQLRAAGNAIVPQVASEFIAAFLECRGSLNP